MRHVAHMHRLTALDKINHPSERESEGETGVLAAQLRFHP
jgi:hypothetical protein